MDKMMHPKEQDMHLMNDKIDAWFARNFNGVDKELLVPLATARNDLKRTLGLPTTQSPLFHKSLNF